MKLIRLFDNLGDQDWASMSCEHKGFLCRHLKHCAYLSGGLFSEQLGQIQSPVLAIRSVDMRQIEQHSVAL